VITALGLLVGAGLVVLAGFTGWRLGRRRSDIGPASAVMCSCGHGFGTHDNGWQCHGRDTRRRNGLHEVDPCPCRRYDGPEPLPPVWSPLLDFPAPADDGTNRLNS
jgi:hypothetical protein